MRVVGYTADAGPQVAAANRFNQPPQAGYQYVMPAYELTFTGGAASASSLPEGPLKVVGASGIARAFFDTSHTTVPPPPRAIDYFGSTFLPGAVVTINVVYEVPISDVPALVGYLDGLYFAL